MKADPGTRRPSALALAAVLLAATSPDCDAPGQDAGTGLKDLARGFARRQVEGWFRSMNRPFPPLRIIGDIYYVGA
jgi:hypothetical protein